MESVMVPMFPLVLGAVLAAIMPVRPDILNSYSVEHHSGVSVFLMWGAAVGQLAGYIYQRIKDFITSSQTGRV